MKYYEMLKMSGEMLGRFHAAGAKIDDYQYTPLYEEFCQMTNSGEKVTYAVLYLAQKYGISERQVYYIVRRFSGEIDAQKVQCLPCSNE